jgi:hypothetical protein
VLLRCLVSVLARVTAAEVAPLLNCNGATPLDLKLRPLTNDVALFVTESMMSLCGQSCVSSVVGRVIYVAVAGLQAVQFAEALVLTVNTLTVAVTCNQCYKAVLTTSCQNSLAVSNCC